MFLLIIGYFLFRHPYLVKTRRFLLQADRNLLQSTPTCNHLFSALKISFQPSIILISKNFQQHLRTSTGSCVTQRANEAQTTRRERRSAARTATRTPRVPGAAGSALRAATEGGDWQCEATPRQVGLEPGTETAVRAREIRAAATYSTRPGYAGGPLTFLMLDLEAGWKSFLHMKLANDFPMAAARSDPPAARTGSTARCGPSGPAGGPSCGARRRSAPPRRQHGRPPAAPLLRHLRGAAARRRRGPGGVREELGPAVGRGAGGAVRPGRRAPGRRPAGGEPRRGPPRRGALTEAPPGDRPSERPRRRVGVRGVAVREGCPRERRR